jgi:cytidylate kinase
MAEAMERARRHWRAERQAGAAGGISLSPTRPPFTIALSREAGANGAEVARAVGERLHWPVYDRELLQLIAEGMGLRTDLLDSVDEKRVGWLRQCLEAVVAVPAVTAGAYTRHLVEALLALAAHGNCVIVGRGAAQILPAATTLRVRLIGPLEERVRAIRERFGLTPAEAARWVERTDRERTRFVQDHFRRDPADAHAYDLVINTARYPVAACADLIEEALRRLPAEAAAVAAP